MARVIHFLWLVCLLAGTEKFIIGIASAQNGYSYPKPRVPLTYPTERPRMIPEEKPTPVVCKEREPEITTTTTTTTTARPTTIQPEIIVERVPFIPDDHLRRDEEMKQTIQDQRVRLEDQDRILVEQDRAIKEREDVIIDRDNDIREKMKLITKHEDTIDFLVEELRRLRGSPNLGVLLGDRIIEYIEMEKQNVARNGNGGQTEIEITRKRTQQRISSGVDSGRPVPNRGNVFRESSRRQFSSSRPRFGSPGSLEDENEVTGGGRGGGRTGEAFEYRRIPISNRRTEDFSDDGGIGGGRTGEAFEYRRVPITNRRTGDFSDDGGSGGGRTGEKFEYRRVPISNRRTGDSIDDGGSAGGRTGELFEYRRVPISNRRTEDSIDDGGSGGGRTGEVFEYRRVPISNRRNGDFSDDGGSFANPNSGDRIEDFNDDGGNIDGRGSGDFSSNRRTGDFDDNGENSDGGNRGGFSSNRRTGDFDDNGGNIGGSSRGGVSSNRRTGDFNDDGGNIGGSSGGGFSNNRRTGDFNDDGENTGGSGSGGFSSNRRAGDSSDDGSSNGGELSSNRRTGDFTDDGGNTEIRDSLGTITQPIISKPPTKTDISPKTVVRTTTLVQQVTTSKSSGIQTTKKPRVNRNAIIPNILKQKRRQLTPSQSVIERPKVIRTTGYRSYLILS